MTVGRGCDIICGMKNHCCIFGARFVLAVAVVMSSFVSIASERIGSVGDWEIHRLKDEMTDAVNYLIISEAPKQPVGGMVDIKPTLMVEIEQIILGETDTRIKAFTAVNLGGVVKFTRGPNQIMTRLDLEPATTDVWNSNRDRESLISGPRFQYGMYDHNRLMVRFASSLGHTIDIKFDIRKLKDAMKFAVSDYRTLVGKPLKVEPSAEPAKLEPRATPKLTDLKVESKPREKPAMTKPVKSRPKKSKSSKPETVSVDI